ncbi:MAG: M48 family metalloprotease [Gemmatimonadales bacterium]
MRRLLVSFLLAAAVACAVNPVTGRRELSLVSESQEIEMGRQGAADVVQSIGAYPDSAAQALVTRVGMKLAALSERPDLPWTFTVVDDPAINAFALPGGFIFVTRGIMTHFNSEGELAAVLGHEIGHVTARHSVRQISRAQVAQLGLGIGMILSEDIAKFGGLASQGLGLVFLKFSRDDESQADRLGFKYALQAGYDVRAMADVFQMLERVSAQAGSQGKLPEWLSTHPDPENRFARTRQWLDTLHTDLSRATLNHDGYLQTVNGMVYGVNPRQGFFRGELFLHPDLKFQLQFPRGWNTQNQAQAVLGVSPGQDAIVELSLAGQVTPAQASTQFLSQQGIRAGQSSQNPINGNPAVTTAFEAQSDQTALRGLVAFVSYDGSTYRILGYTAADRIATYNNDFLGSVSSFRRLTDQSALSVVPNRIETVRVPRAMTLEQFYARYPSTVPVEQIALINALQAGDTIPSGRLVKRVR